MSDVIYISEPPYFKHIIIFVLTGNNKASFEDNEYIDKSIIDPSIANMAIILFICEYIILTELNDDEAGGDKLIACPTL